MARPRCSACGCFVGQDHATVDGKLYCPPCEELLPSEEEAALAHALHTHLLSLKGGSI